LLMMKFLLLAEKYLVFLFLHLLGITLTYREHSPRPQTPCIYIFWHRNIIPLMYLYRKHKLAIIISSSLDGELVAAPCKLLGFEVVRGSSTREGTKALHQMIKLAGDYNLVVTPDGPKGPREVLKKSVLFIAYHTKLPIIPVAVDVDREWLFPSWDLFRLPKPNSTVNITYGKPFVVTSKTGIEEALPKLQFEMDRLHYSNRESSVKE